MFSLKLALAALGVLALSSHATPLEEREATPEYKEITITKGGTKYCFDVQESILPNDGNPTRVNLYYCAGLDNQKWAYNPSTLEIRSKLGDIYCLDVSSGKLELRVCDTTTTQEFTMNGPAIQSGGKYALPAHADGRQVHRRARLQDGQ